MASPTYARLAVIQPVIDFSFPLKEHSLPSSSTQLPPNLYWFGGQIAGHKTEIDKKGQLQLGFLKDRTVPHRILKPVMKDKRGKCEKAFYLDVWSVMANTEMRKLRPVVPRFYGLRTFKYQGNEFELLDLEDISKGYSLPAIIDIKIGKRTFGPDATPEKMQKEIVKYPPQEVVGFRILGFKVQNEQGDKKAVMSREECLRLSAEDIRGALRQYFSHRQQDEIEDVIDQILLQLEFVRDVATSGYVNIYSSSILICYEADPLVAPKADIRMIDFSHVFKGNGKPDENYLHGLNTLTRHLEAIARRT